MQKFIIKLNKNNLHLMQNPRAECFLLPEESSAAFVQKSVMAAQNADKLLLGANRQMCVKHNLDGFIADFSKSENIAKDYAELTKGLKGKIIGGICRNRRHEAMILSECEPDFIVFRAWRDGAEKVRELCDWYNEFFLIQSALLPMDEDVDCSTFKTDFVIVNSDKFTK